MKRDWPPEIALSCYKEENQVNMHQENKGLSSINQSYLFFLFFYCCNCSFEHYYFNHKRMDSHIELNYFRKYISKGIDMCNDPSYFKYIINKCNWVEWKVACWNRYIIEIKQTENFHSFFFRDIFFMKPLLAFHLITSRPSWSRGRNWLKNPFPHKRKV